MKQIRKERPGTSQKRKSIMQQVTAYVDEHLGECLTLKIISDHCDVSISTITQLFQRYEDMSFHSFVTARRMKKAEELIGNGVPLEQVGKQVGYRDHSTFYRAFRQHYQISPREYRSRRFAEDQE